MSTFSGRDRGLAALSADLVPHGRGVDPAVNGMLDAVNAVTQMAIAPGAKAREDFFLAVQHARANRDASYSDAFEHAAWQAIAELRTATGGVA